MTGRPVAAVASSGRVHITCDPGTARDLADALSTTYATSVELETFRPRWMDDVVAILRAAAIADVQNGDQPVVVAVPLRVVEGGAQC